MFAYHVDDWLVVRTDMAGHSSVINTEFWSEWTFEEKGLLEATDEDVIAVIKRARHTDGPWLGCEEGWCSKCESTFTED